MPHSHLRICFAERKLLIIWVTKSKQLLTLKNRLKLLGIDYLEDTLLMALTSPTPSTRRHLSHLMLLLEGPRLSPNRGWTAFLSRLAGAWRCARAEGPFLQRPILLPGGTPF